MLQGRICAELRESYRVLYSGNEFEARISGRLRHAANSRLDYPIVGDDVAFEHDAGAPAIVHEVLPRRSCIVRKAAGTAFDEQPIVANVDYLLIVCGLDGDFNVRRIERYAALAASGGVEPVLVLNKADLCRDLDVKLIELEDANVSMPVHVLSAALGDGLDTLAQYLDDGTTVALTGSSGAGKSTITNALLGRTAQITNATCSVDDRGRHTTTSRQLFALPGGAFLIDTPGMRELHLWAAADALGETFSDIEMLTRACRFSDCAHETEPGCAIRAALGTTLDESRFANYQKLQREQAFLDRKMAAQEHMRFKRRFR